MQRFDVINHFIEVQSLESYLEVGAGTGACYHQIKCKRKLAIDIGYGTEPGNPWILKATTFELASRLIKEVGTNKCRIFDCAFVDASHKAEDVLNDIHNLSMILCPNSQIFFHDVSPPDRRWAGGDQDPTVSGWCGNAWRAFVGLLNNKQFSGFCIDVDYGVGVLHVDNPEQLARVELSTITEDEFFSDKRRWLNIMDPRIFGLK